MANTAAYLDPRQRSVASMENTIILFLTKPHDLNGISGDFVLILDEETSGEVW
jgi:hypothetical protein